MSVRPKFNLFLVHQETGQRYPVGEEVVLGRVSGDILFPDDPKVSNQHARILNTPKGVAVHDLGSSNGTSVDGTKLDPKKVYVFKVGSVIAVGGQQLKLQEVSLAKAVKRASRSRKRKRSRKSKGFFDLQTFLALLLVLGAGAVMLKNFAGGLIAQLSKNQPKNEEAKVIMPTPLEIVEREMREAFSEYTELGKANVSQKISDKDLVQSIRQKLLPKLNSASVKMEVLRPQNEWEKNKIAANKKLLAALIGQVTAMAAFTETHLPRYSTDLEKFSDQVEKLNVEVQKLDDARRPANF
jgi:pSer/pThr/pTyr-binding forkhead associated (FHA) protein